MLTSGGLAILFQLCHETALNVESLLQHFCVSSSPVLSNITSSSGLPASFFFLISRAYTVFFLFSCFLSLHPVCLVLLPRNPRLCSRFRNSQRKIFLVFIVSSSPDFISCPPFLPSSFHSVFQNIMKVTALLFAPLCFCTSSCPPTSSFSSPLSF